MLMLLSVLLPIVCALIAFKLCDDRKRHSFTALSLLLCSALAVSAALICEGDSFTLLNIGGGLYLRFAADRLSLCFIVLVSAAWLIVQLHAFGYMQHEGRQAQFFGFYMLSYASLIALALAKNAVTMYMCFELMTLCSMPLVLHNGSEVSREAALKYLGYSTLGAALALLGFFLLAPYAESLEFIEGGVTLLNGGEGIKLVSCLLIAMGFGCKAGLVPLQMWLTEAHPVAPSPASAVLSGIITKGGVLAIMRTVYYIFGVSFLRGTWVQTLVLALSVITIFMGSMLALRESLLKKRLAYSTISNVSYVLFGIFTFTELGFIGALLQLVFHALAKNALFLAAGSVIYASGKARASELKGIGRNMPVTMWCFALASLSLIGIPPLGGFVSKLYLALAALSESSVLSMLGLIVLMLSALLTAFYLLTIIASAFFPGSDAETEDIKEVPLNMLLPPIIFSALLLILGIAPSGLIAVLKGMAAALL